MLNLHLLFFKMGISHREGLAKRGAQSLQATLLRKQFYFLRRWRQSEPWVHKSCFLPDPPPTTPLRLGKPQHTGSKQNGPSSLSPLRCQRWPSRSGGSRTQRVPVQSAASQRWRWGGGWGSRCWRGQRRRAQCVFLSAPAPALAIPCSAAARLTGACLSDLHGWFNKKHGRFASPPAIKPLTLRCAIATGSADAARRVLKCIYFTKRYRQVGQRREITAY